MMISGHVASLNGTLPWTRSCFVCGTDNPRGLHLRSRVENGIVSLEYVTRDSDLGWRSAVHGGLTMMLLDEVMTWSAILEQRQACVSAEVTTRMIKPVTTGCRLRAEGWLESRKGKLLLTNGKITDLSGEILATASGKFLPMPAGQVPMCGEDFLADAETLPLDKLLAG